jgi:hypothetical protein
MAKTVAERQAEYRRNRATAGDNGDRRLNCWVSTQASMALKRLSKLHGVTQREALERLVIEADARVLETLDPDSQEWASYFDVTQ